MSSTLPDTFSTTQEELLLFAGSVLLGVPAGMLFDFWRILRRLRPHPAWLVAAEDMLWVISTGMLLLCYADTFAKGVFRGYFALGCAIGFVLYAVTVGRAVTNCIAGLLHLLQMPVGRICDGFASICRKAICSFVNSNKKDKKE
ncbi:MAG: spore cortex biosynthesis protein YabQ [Oscillospiraceae bacterium]|nr:spore cortex biosynthesis protein YabQ [Oscillospiraceae bacterium]